MCWLLATNCKKSKHFLSGFSGTGSVLTFPQLIFITLISRYDSYLHFISHETEAQRRKTTCPKPHALKKWDQDSKTRAAYAHRPRPCPQGVPEDNLMNFFLEKFFRKLTLVSPFYKLPKRQSQVMGTTERSALAPLFPRDGPAQLLSLILSFHFSGKRVPWAAVVQRDPVLLTVPAENR